jgi:hypothetical protein
VCNGQAVGMCHHIDKNFAESAILLLSFLDISLLFKFDEFASRTSKDLNSSFLLRLGDKILTKKQNLEQQINSFHIEKIYIS